MPICRKCGVDKPQELFEKSKVIKCGYTTRCKQCAHEYKMQWAIENNIKEKRKDYFKAYNASAIANERKKRWKKENPEQNTAINKAWRQNNVEHIKTYHAITADHRRILNAKNYEKNKEARNVQSKKWRKENPEKHRIHNQNRENRKIGGKLSLDIIQKLMVKQNGLCTYCKIDLTSCKYHIDHIIPLAKGGRHEDENVQLLCQSCNMRKHTTSHEDFVLKMGVPTWPLHSYKL